MLRKKAAFFAVLVVKLVIAMPFGNVANVHPKGTVITSVCYSKQFFFTGSPAFYFFTPIGSWPSMEISSNRLGVAVGYAFSNIGEFYVAVGGADLNPLVRITSLTQIGWNGSWELFPGFGVKFKTNDIKFSQYKFHFLFHLNYFYIRSLYSSFPSGVWLFSGRWTENEINGAVAGVIHTKHRMTYYAGIGYRFSQVSAYITSQRLTPSLPPGRNISKVKGVAGITAAYPPSSPWERYVLVLRRGFLPFLGINWEFTDGVFLCGEVNLADVSTSGIKMGFSLGVSN